jgi:hypothetical protein
VRRARGVARAVVHEQHVEGQAAGALGDAGKHAADGRLLVARHHDGETAPVKARRFRARVLRRDQRTATCRAGRRHAEQAGDRRRQLEHGARLA